MCIINPNHITDNIITINYTLCTQFAHIWSKPYSIVYKEEAGDFDVVCYLYILTSDFRMAAVTQMVGISFLTNKYLCLVATMLVKLSQPNLYN